jgi:hypothetical protein
LKVAGDKWLVTSKSSSMRLSIDFSSETLGDKRLKADVFKMLKEINCKLRILRHTCPANVREKLRHSSMHKCSGRVVITTTALQVMLKGDLQIKMKGHAGHQWLTPVILAEAEIKRIMIQG